MSAKGKGNAKGKTGGQGHTLPRTRLSAEKFAGTVLAWKGKYGWIKPGEEIEHEKASLRNGSLFCSVNDIMDGSGELHPGAPCEFHIWEDDTGLGAEEIIETGPPDPSAIPDDQKGKGFKGSKGSNGAMGGKVGGKTNGFADKGYGKAASPVGSWGASKGYEPYGGKGVGGKGKTPYGAGSPYGGKGKGDTDKGKNGSKGKGSKGKGHLLPRTRVSAEKFQGTVNSWKGKYGWITPAEEIEHEKAKRHRGGIFVSMDDLDGGLTELTEGATVEFHIWEDESGLGAEEVIQY